MDKGFTISGQVNARVKITTISAPDYEGKSTLSKYECYAEFGSWDDDQELIKWWLRFWCEVAEEHIDWQILENHNFARAIAGKYFAEKWVRVKENTCTEFVADSQMPGGEPAWSTEKYKLWVREVSSEVVETAESVARLILKQCGYGGKVSAQNAREIFHARHGDFLWEDVLREFRKLGGAHTDKYFRKDR